jgi:phasin family protein
MYPFPQSVNPAVRSHMDAQTAFLNDMSKSLFQSFQQMCDLNIRLVQTMLEESTIAGQQMLTADRQTNVLSAAASRAQPATEKLRAYQQHISKLAADAQVQLAKVAEEHVQNTTRTAQQLAEEVARTASEETERGMRTQQDTMRKFADPFAQTGNGQAQPAWESRERAGASLQSGAEGMRQGANAQGGSAQSGSAQSGSAQSGSAQSGSSQGSHTQGGSTADMQGQAGMRSGASDAHGQPQGNPSRNP